MYDVMFVYDHPDILSEKGTEWIEWVFHLRKHDKRHALEFLEGWVSTRIVIAGSIPWVSSCLVGIIWTARGGDPIATFTVAMFVLTSSSGINLFHLIRIANPCYLARS